MPRPNPDRMSFLEHLEELRVRLIRCMLSLVVGFAVCWYFHEQIFRFLTHPLRVADPNVKFIFTGPSEALILHMKMAFFVGIFLMAPYLLYQVWAFVSPGLYAHEKAYAVPFIVMGTVFFLGGGAFGHYFLFPATFKFLIQFGGMDMQFLPKVDEYYTFYSWFLLGLGLVFELPVVIFVLARIGIVTPRFLLRQFKYAVIIAFVAAAFITPSPDVVNQTFLALPIIGLYLLGIGVAWLFGKPRRVPKPEAAASTAAPST
jgi:sec-independent protein translocase protein TatC